MLKVSENLQLNMLPKSQKATRKLESYLRSNLLQYLKCALKKKTVTRPKLPNECTKLLKLILKKNLQGFSQGTRGRQ